MKSLRSAIGVLGASALVATLSACSGGASTQPESIAPGVSGVEARLHPLTNPQRVLALLESRPAPSVARGRSRMSPRAKSSSLLYLGNSANGSVGVYSYPSLNPLGVLLGFTQPYTMCIDAAQDIYVTDFGGGRVIEYAHGAVAPARSLADHQGVPVACAVDPSTGDLAVSNFVGPSSSPGNVILYTGAKGTPTKFTAPSFNNYFFAAYDANGNLFVDGLNASGDVLLAELPKGKSAFKAIAMNVTIGFPGGVAWDGAFLAVGDQFSNTIYQFKVSGSNATEQGSTTLNDATDVFQFFTTGGSTKHPQATAVVGADFGGGAADQWQYPAGGTPVKTITGLDGPEGAAISK
ncbi:MAG: hypothetical protein WA814_07250 [Candidatus Baltobacteraceae bacterium]